MGTVTFPLMDGQLTYAATLDARAYHLGETALLTLVIDNKLPHPVNGISIRFNNYISLFGSKYTQNMANNNLSSSGLASSSNATSITPTEDTFTESESLTLMTERYTVKPNENVKKVVSIVIPQTAFSTTKYTRSMNLMAYLDVTINVQSHMPSVSEKSFQVPIYVINKLPLREPNTTPPFLAQANMGNSNGSLTASGSSDSLLTSSSIISSSPTVLNPDRTVPSPHGSFKELSLISAAPSKVAGIVIWTNDNEVSQCTLCSHEFTLLRRRHHCRSCGRVMCGKCGKEATVDELFGPKPQRLCTLCLTELHNLLVLDTSLSSSTSSASGTTEIDEVVPSLSFSFHSASADDSISPRTSSIRLLVPQRSASSSKLSTATAQNTTASTSSPPSETAENKDATPETTPKNDDDISKGEL